MKKLIAGLMALAMHGGHAYVHTEEYRPQFCAEYVTIYAR